MTDNSDATTATAHTFRFHSGQTVTLDEHQIGKIPYIAAMVSTADHFEFVRDEDGYYKIDPLVDFQCFSVVLRSLSFCAVRQLFTHLPEDNDCLAFIDLLDFLGLISDPDPTLNEVDTTFFSTLIYSPMLKTQFQSIRRPIIQNMAVQFAIAMARGYYDWTEREVIDQIHWFIVFILSSCELFGPRLRHHVFKTAEFCFSTFEPSLLKPLNQLIKTAQAGVSENISIGTRIHLLPMGEIDGVSDAENTAAIEDMLYQQNSTGRWLWIIKPPTLQSRRDLLLHQSYQTYPYSWFLYIVPSESSLLEPLYERVLEIMYERLQHEVCQRAVAHKCTYLRQAVQTASYSSIPRDTVDSKTRENVEYRLPFTYIFDERSMKTMKSENSSVHSLCTEAEWKNIRKFILDDVFNRESVTKEIRERIQDGLCALTSKLERKYGRLIEDIRTIASEKLNQHEGNYMLRIIVGSPTSEDIQEEAVCYELLLKKIHSGSLLADELYQRVLSSLYDVALEQILQWRITQIDIDQLREQISAPHRSQKNPLTTSKTNHDHRSIPRNKPLPKPRIKHAKQR